MAAPAFQTVGARAAGTGTTLTPTMPASIAANDTLIAYVYVNASGVTFTTPSGWTAGPVSNAGANSAAMFWKNAAGADPSPALVWSTSAAAFAKVIRFNGAGTPASPIGATVTNFANSNSNVTCAGITTTAANSAIIYLIGLNLTVTSLPVPNPPGQYTLIASAAATPTDAEFWGVVNTSGAVSTAVNVTATPANANWVVIGFEINGSGAAGTDNVRATGVMQQVLESYNPTLTTNMRVTGVMEQVLENYSSITKQRVTGVAIQVLRTTATQKPRAWGYGLWG